jgi:hypothetical protein
VLRVLRSIEILLMVETTELVDWLINKAKRGVKDNIKFCWFEQLVQFRRCRFEGEKYDMLNQKF